MKNRFIQFLFLGCLIFLATACEEDAFEPEVFGDLFGEVFLNNEGSPLADVTISTNPPTSTILTDADGRFALENIKTGAYSVRAEKDGFITSVESVTLFQDQASNIVIQLVSDSLNSKAPSAAFNPIPADGSQNQDIDLTLQWSTSDPEDDNLTFDVSIYTNDPNESILIAEQISDSMVNVTLEYGQTYYWQVATYDDVNAPVFSNVFQFTTMDFPDNRLLYAQKVNGSYQIFSSDIDGNAAQLTSGNTNSWRPRMNPQRTKVAYISDSGIESHIFIMNRDGSDVTQVTSIPIAGFNKLELDFSWSPDGSRLLYMNNANLYTVNIDGSGLNNLLTAPTNLRFIECDWTAQGNLIAVRTIGADPYDSFISIYDQNGTFLTTVLNNPEGGSGGPMFSIAASAMLYTQDASGYEGTDGRQLDSRIFIRNLAVNQTTDISVNKQDGTNDLDARYSPDGAFVIFVNTNNDGISQRDIYRMDIDGSNRTLLFEDAITPEWK
ncbi:MAG: carboxypeptidase regulatory-like domain-containing protein [Saprospiraceae bacterium]